MRRLIVQKETIIDDRIHITDKEDISYLFSVLRMSEGESLLVSDGEGNAWETRIEQISRGGIELRIVSGLPAENGEGVRITLYQGLPKGSKMEDLVRKSTELGVFQIAPVSTARSIPGEAGVSAAKVERWRRIAKEASRQARRLHVPKVTDVMKFSEAVKELEDGAYDLILALFELEEERTLKQALREFKSVSSAENDVKSIAVFIGPEGGFEREEVDLVKSRGGVSVTVGNTILRTETAGPAAVAMILYELEL